MLTVLSCHCKNYSMQVSAPLIRDCYMFAIGGFLNLSTVTAMSNPSFIIRKAERKDCSTILDMIHELAAFENMADQNRMTCETLERDGFDKEPPYYHCLVAETKEGEVIAYALYVYQYSTWNGRVVYLEDLYVRQSHQRKGVGTALLKELCNVSTEAGCSLIRLTCLAWNKNALQLYKSLGFKDLTVEQNLNYLHCYMHVMKRSFKDV